MRKRSFTANLMFMKQLGEQTWVQEGPTNIGFFDCGGEVLLIDSGNDKESGRKINKILKEKNWRLKGIINTHSNADHIGGNDYLQRNLGCEVYASATEKAFIESPVLETSFLWGGREIGELRNKFFQARPSRVTEVITKEGEWMEGLHVVPLAGHFFQMIGLKTPDGTFFAADSLFGKDILEKYKIPFIYDVAAFRKSIETVRNQDVRFVVPSHGPISGDIGETAEWNLKRVDEIEAALLEILERELSFDSVLKELCDRFGIALNGGQFALVGSTVRSFLTYLADEGSAKYLFKENYMLWSRT